MSETKECPWYADGQHRGCEQSHPEQRETPRPRIAWRPTGVAGKAHGKCACGAEWFHCTGAEAARIDLVHAEHCPAAAAAPRCACGKPEVTEMQGRRVTHTAGGCFADPVVLPAAAPREAPPREPDWRELLVDVAREFDLLGCTLRDLPALVRARLAEAEALLAAARAEVERLRVYHRDDEPSWRHAAEAAEDRERALREALRGCVWVLEKVHAGQPFSLDESVRAEAALNAARAALAEEGSPRGR